jgi:hypothetical protein
VTICEHLSSCLYEKGKWNFKDSDSDLRTDHLMGDGLVAVRE